MRENDKFLRPLKANLLLLPGVFRPLRYEATLLLFLLLHQSHSPTKGQKMANETLVHQHF
ncbi:hypothetical protein GQ61_01200 [Candidatus Nucleicultrix amoebiphila FS5]|uniref:Uncharacterized protein n=1 Tax=Candidatus Nucleicultrix amoebiphila FS5 TaxID=1414854 RepID=A0A1W6N2S6_9PROT|nr:hypothetical protein GQ61_01200 [Candidatus Nucleicultrix amoebiphila FS5]